MLSAEHKACAQSQNLLSYLAGALINYKYEGVEFSPTIIFCDNFDAVLKSFPGGVAHTIGVAKLDVSSGSGILKDCGPLSGNNWFIFIERLKNDKIKYGVFSYFNLPTAMSIEETISICGVDFCVLLKKIGPNTINVKGAKGSSLVLVFSTFRNLSSVDSDIKNFSKNCSQGLPQSTHNSNFESYFCKFLISSVSSSHGTILLCVDKIECLDVKELKDSIRISPALDFYSAFLEFLTAKTADSILTLQRCEELLLGFMKSDGMIVFDTKGCVIAYRVFYKSARAAKKGGGGARLRAFEGVKKLAGTQIVSALFRSQDGLTLYHGGGE